MDWLQSHKVAIGVTLAVSLGTVAVTYLYKRGRKQWKNVGTVSQLFIYPIKSTRGVGVKEMMCTRKGSHFIDQNVYDRSFMMIQSDGNMQTARAEPKLVLIATKVEDGILTLNAPGMPVLNVEIPINSKQAITCRVWGEETLGVDCGDEVSQWLSDFLKKEYRLVYHPQTHLRGITGRDPKYSKLNAKKGKIIYHDGSPSNILSEASLEDLNSQLESKLTVRSFRPNILVKDCAPFEEDNWTYIKIGDTELDYARNCFRCVLTTVDVDKGTKHPKMEPLTTLKKYRLCNPEDRPTYGSSPLFGISLNIIKEGKLKVGDVVYARQ